MNWICNDCEHITGYIPEAGRCWNCKGRDFRRVGSFKKWEWFVFLTLLAIALGLMWASIQIQ